MKKRKDGSIMEATEAELLDVYLKDEWYEIMDFHLFLSYCTENWNVRIVEEPTDA